MKEEIQKSNHIYQIFHRGLGFIYLVALFPLFHQIVTLIGKNGLLSAQQLLKKSYDDQGVILSVLQFPSLYHIYPHDISLYLLVFAGCIGALMLLFHYKTFYGAIISWISFLSITSIGGDFFIIIIDLLLAEIGFLALFSTYYLEKHQRIPPLVDFSIKLLNFKLWFCMGVIKFYIPTDAWSEWTFFDYFFHAQPMPTPLSPILNESPQILKYIAIIGVFIAEMIIPFFVFGKSTYRKIAFFTFCILSILIQISGNYGYFNLLSIVLAIPTLSKKPNYRNGLDQLRNIKIRKPTIHKLLNYIIIIQISLQILYIFYVFHPNPKSSQNHFNYIFSNITTDNKVINTLITPFKWTEYWRICNPYGVFKGIPYYHSEIRISGSQDGENWENYTFKYLPSSNTDYLGLYAPFYPRLDHLMFYETIGAQNYRWNPLNRYYSEGNTWICNFIHQLLENDPSISKLLKNNPFLNESPPKYIKTEVFRLWFDETRKVNWQSKPMNYTNIYSKEKNCEEPIITFDQAMKTIYDQGNSSNE